MDSNNFVRKKVKIYLSTFGYSYTEEMHWSSTIIQEAHRKERGLFNASAKKLFHHILTKVIHIITFSTLHLQNLLYNVYIINDFRVKIILEYWPRERSV